MASPSAHAESTTGSRNAEAGGFPYFTDGDTYIVLSPSRQYHLHSRTLRMHSTLLNDMLTEDNAAQLSSKARKEGITMRYRVELDMPGSDINIGHVGRLRLRVSPSSLFIC